MIKSQNQFDDIMNNKIEFIPLMVVRKESIHVVTVDFEYQFIEVIA